MTLSFRRVAWLPALALLVAACGGDEATTAGGGDRPTVVVSTTVLGDVVEELSGGQFDVVTVMPLGTDPHDFQASAKQAKEIREADALIVNGGGLEEGLSDVIGAAEGDGTPTFVALSAVETIEFGGAGDEHGDEEPDDHAGEADPHFFQDPSRMAVAVQAIGDFLIDNLDDVDAAALQASVAGYVEELETLDGVIEELLADIDGPRRVLVTNHDAFGYFADRYAFEVVGTVIPSGSTADGTSARELADLAQLIRDEGVPAIFAENITSSELASTLAEEVGQDVEVVALFSDSLGEAGSGGESYVAMIHTNVERIADALG